MTNEQPVETRSLGRLILAVVVGWLAAAVPSVAIDHVFHVSGVYPPYGEPMTDAGLLLLAFAYRAVLAVIGAYVASWIGRNRATTAVLIMGSLGTIAWLAGGIAMWGQGGEWYPILGAVTSLPLSWLGWWWYRRGHQTHPAHPGVS